MVNAPVIVVPTNQTSSTFDPVALLNSSQQQAIIRPMNPPPGIAGWVMDVVGDEEVRLTSNISDHYTDNNTTIQDNIALPPAEITTTGLVAELLLTPSAAGAVDSPQNQTQGSLIPIEAFFPGFTPQAAQIIAQKAAAQINNDERILTNNTLAKFQQALSPQEPGQTRQSNAFAFFVQLWKARQLFTVETPWGFFNNMAMASLSGRQGRESRYQTQFTITFKQIRFAGSVVITAGQIVGRAAAYTAPTVNNNLGVDSGLTPEQAVTEFANIGRGAFNLPPVLP